MFYIAVDFPVCSSRINEDIIDDAKFTRCIQDYQGNSVMDFECSFNHSYKVLLRNKHYDILFQMGIYPLNDGYHQQAITSAASALERFLEDFVKHVLLHKGWSPSRVESFWKPFRNSSERQYGAFLLTSAVTGWNGAKNLYEKNICGVSCSSIRNDCVHKGKIPSRKTTLEFLYFVYEFIKKQ